MRFFALLDFQYMVLAFFLGLLGVILTYVAWAGYIDRPADEKEEAEGFEAATSHEDKQNPVAPFLLFIFVGATLWAIAYVVVTGIFGGPIG